MNKPTFIVTLVLALALALPHAAQAQQAASVAQDYPSRAVRIIVPFSAGGATDLVARQVAHKLEEAWAQPVVVDNRSGAGGNIGAYAVARAEPDGYTLLLGSMGPLVINQFLQKDLPFNPRKDFAPITSLVDVENVLVVSNSLPVNNVKELIAYAKANPGKLNYASSGFGTTDHLAAEMFKDMAKVDMVHVPFKGGSLAIHSILAGDTPVSFATTAVALTHVRAGKLRALGVAGSRRLALLPTTPTVAEAGVDGYDVTTWYGLFAPAGTSPEIVAKLNRDVVLVLNLPEIRKVLQDNGFAVAPMTPGEFSERISNDTKKWSALIQRVGMTRQ